MTMPSARPPRRVLTGRHTLAAALLAVALTLVTALGALAAEADDVAEAVSTTGGYAEPGSGVDDGALDRVAGDLAAEGHRVGLVALATTPSGGATIFAEVVLEEVGTGSVLVITPDEVGVASAVYNVSGVDRALDLAIDDLREGPVVGLTALANALTGSDVAVPAGSDGGAGAPADGPSGPGTGTVLLVLIVVGVGLLIWRGRRRSRGRSEERLAEAREQVAQRLSTVADRILALDDRVRLSDDPEVETAYVEATSTYRSAQDRLETIGDLAGLRALADEVDRARWQLAVVEARLDGRPAPPPPEQRPAACFFDPDHPPATEEGTVRSPAGERTVGVCPACAARLRAGERPELRTIPVDGRPVPAPAAPREHGGGGLGGLGSALEILVAGMTRGAAYEVGRGSRRSRRTTGRSRRIPTPPAWGGARATRTSGSAGRSRSTGGSRRGTSSAGRTRRITKGRGGRRL
jgi:hypothetical protein